MFNYIKGKYELSADNFIVIDCAGIGFQIYTSLNTKKRMPKLQEDAKIYTYLHLREEIMDLYGFFDMEELNCFKMLISVSGVGPKVAIAVLSELTAEHFATSIVKGDAKALTAVPGVGLKIAQRMILELKDKISKEQISGSDTYYPDEDNLAGNKAGEALKALLVLGYTKGEATKALQGIDMDQISLEECVRAALKRLLR